MIRLVLTILSVSFAVSATAVETADLPAQYKAIIEHSPFGQVNTGAAPAAPWLASWQFVGITSSNSGNGVIQAIIFNKDSNRSFFRTEGESLDGTITLVKIDADTKQPKIVLKNGLENGTLMYPERTAVAAAPPPGTPPPGVSPPPGTPAPPNAAAVRRIPFRRGN